MSGTYNPMPESTYEAIFKYAGEASTSKGKPCINITLVLRNDVDQPYKNKFIWESLYHRKEETRTEEDLKYEGYSAKRINQISKAAGIENHANVGTIEDWCRSLKGKCVRVTTVNEEFNGKVSEKVKWFNETKFPVCNHIWKGEETKAAAPAPAAVVTPPPVAKKTAYKEEDVPFDA